MDMIVVKKRNKIDNGVDYEKEDDEKKIKRVGI